MREQIAMALASIRLWIRGLFEGLKRSTHTAEAYWSDGYAEPIDTSTQKGQARLKELMRDMSRTGKGNSQ